MTNPEILRGAQDDKPPAVILSAAKGLWRTYGESPEETLDNYRYIVIITGKNTIYRIL